MQRITLTTKDGQRIHVCGPDASGADHKCWQGPWYGTTEGRERAGEFVCENAHLLTLAELKRAWRKIAKS